MISTQVRRRGGRRPVLSRNTIDTKAECLFGAGAWAVPTEYSVRVVAIAAAGQRPLPFSSRMTALFVALLTSLQPCAVQKPGHAAEDVLVNHTTETITTLDTSSPLGRTTQARVESNLN